jgi:hypothetical protein
MSPLRHKGEQYCSARFARQRRDGRRGIGPRREQFFLRRKKMNTQNFNGPLMKYSDAYFNGEIDTKVFSLLAILAMVYVNKQTESVKFVLEKLFSKKSLTPKKEQAIKDELHRLYPKDLPLDGDSVEDVMSKIKDVLS